MTDSNSHEYALKYLMLLLQDQYNSRTQQKKRLAFLNSHMINILMVKSSRLKSSSFYCRSVAHKTSVEMW